MAMRRADGAIQGHVYTTALRRFFALAMMHRDEGASQGSRFYNLSSAVFSPMAMMHPAGMRSL
jgi:hypothetical protein